LGCLSEPPEPTRAQPGGAWKGAGGCRGMMSPSPGDHAARLRPAGHPHCGLQSPRSWRPSTSSASDQRRAHAALRLRGRRAWPQGTAAAPQPPAPCPRLGPARGGRRSPVRGRDPLPCALSKLLSHRLPTRSQPSHCHSVIAFKQILKDPKQTNNQATQKQVNIHTQASKFAS